MIFNDIYDFSGCWNALYLARLSGKLADEHDMLHIPNDISQSPDLWPTYPYCRLPTREMSMVLPPKATASEMWRGIALSLKSAGEFRDIY